MQISVTDANGQLSDLLDDVTQGKEVIIVAADGSACKLVALPRAPRPLFGSARGSVEIGQDFGQPIEGFQEYMP